MEAVGDSGNGCARKDMLASTLKEVSVDEKLGVARTAVLPVAHGRYGMRNLSLLKSRRDEVLCLKHPSKNEPPRSLN
jgi:hypothetical protein